MERLRSTPRPDWPRRLEARGFAHHTANEPYWTEEVCYRFSPTQIEELHAASARLHGMCLEAADFAIRANRWKDFAIDPRFAERIALDWEAEPPSLYGRLDLAWDGIGPPRLLEYNADTPTALLEASVAQWDWVEEVHPGADQYNSIHEALVAKWTDLRDALDPGPLHLAHCEGLEDESTIHYLRETAEAAGLRTSTLRMSDIGWHERFGCFVDREGRPIRSIFKLYPWEWLAREEFAPRLLETADRTRWIEPSWKMLLSNKAMLALLWELFPGDPNLLEARLDGPGEMRSYAKKPILSREGANVTLVGPGLSVRTPGPYGAEGWVYQALAPIPTLDGRVRPVVGSWIVDGEPCGIGIRESDGPVTTDLARFVPHFIG